MREVREPELTNVVERTWNLTTPHLTVLAVLLASSNESHQKVVKKMSKYCQKLIQNFIKRQRFDAQHCKSTHAEHDGFCVVDSV